MTYINITKFVLINQLVTDHSMIEMHRLKNVIVFIQTNIAMFFQLRQHLHIAQLNLREIWNFFWSKYSKICFMYSKKYTKRCDKN